MNKTLKIILQICLLISIVNCELSPPTLYEPGELTFDIDLNFLHKHEEQIAKYSKQDWNKLSDQYGTKLNFGLTLWQLSQEIWSDVKSVETFYHALKIADIDKMREIFDHKFSEPLKQVINKILGPKSDWTKTKLESIVNQVDFNTRLPFVSKIGNYLAGKFIYIELSFKTIFWTIQINDLWNIYSEMAKAGKILSNVNDVEIEFRSIQSQLNALIDETNQIDYDHLMSRESFEPFERKVSAIEKRCPNLQMDVNGRVVTLRSLQSQLTTIAVSNLISIGMIGAKQLLIGSVASGGVFLPIQLTIHVSFTAYSGYQYYSNANLITRLEQVAVQVNYWQDEMNSIDERLRDLRKWTDRMDKKLFKMEKHDLEIKVEQFEKEKRQFDLRKAALDKREQELRSIVKNIQTKQPVRGL
ncbi:hypothetical protein BLOT_002333 [Blomia tropicalis]|nr:hypothetical protein BLOT_002333 [Blomia tropicalis]